MAKFQKGNNVKLGKTLLPDQKAIRESTRDALYLTFSKYLKLSFTESKKIIDQIKNEPNQCKLTLLEIGIIQSLNNFMAKGDYRYIEYPLNHIIGKAKETIDLGNAGETIKIKVSYMKENKE